MYVIVIHYYIQVNYYQLFYMYYCLKLKKLNCKIYKKINHDDYIYIISEYFIAAKNKIIEDYIANKLTKDEMTIYDMRIY